MPYKKALRAANTHRHDFLNVYVNDFGNVLDMDAIRGAKIKMGVDPLGGAGIHYWAAIAEHYNMKLQPDTEHPHGLSDRVFDEIFTEDKPVIFAFHGYPWLIHRLTYRRTNHDSIHVRGYRKEGTITTAFDVTVLNELDRFQFVMDAINRLPQMGNEGTYLKQKLQDNTLRYTAKTWRKFGIENGNPPRHLAIDAAKLRIHCNPLAASGILGRFAIKASVTPEMEGSRNKIALSVTRFSMSLYFLYLSCADMCISPCEPCAAVV